jgi:hypothetical protein
MSLKQIVKGILTDLGFKNLQYLWFKNREVNGERVFEPAKERFGGKLVSWIV